MLLAIKSTLLAISGWNEDRRFSKHYRRIRIIDKEIVSIKECIAGVVPNSYTEGFVTFLHRKLERLLIQRIKATKKFGKVIDSFRS